jgi:hypothetical protein
MRFLALVALTLAFAVGPAAAAPAPFAKPDRARTLSCEQLCRLLCERLLVVQGLEPTRRQGVWEVRIVVSYFPRGSGKPFGVMAVEVAADGPRAALLALLNDPRLACEVYRGITAHDVDERRIAEARRQLRLLRERRAGK